MSPRDEALAALLRRTMSLSIFDAVKTSLARWPRIRPRPKRKAIKRCQEAKMPRVLDSAFAGPAAWTVQRPCHSRVPACFEGRAYPYLSRLTLPENTRRQAA